MNDTVIKVMNLTKKKNNKYILNKVNLELKKKEVLGLIGPNGAGKTTLMKCIAGISTYI